MRLYFCHFVPAFLLLIVSGLASHQIVLDSYAAPNVTVEGFGLSHADLNRTVVQALDLCQVRDILNGTRHRLLSSELRTEVLGCAKATDERYRATIYDYTQGRTIFVDGSPFDPTFVSVTEANIQPIPSQEELREAGEIAGIRSDEIVSGSMPPYISRDFANGTSHRILKLAITSATSSRIVYVNMNNGTVEENPEPSENILACSAPQRRSHPIGPGVQGTANLQISQAGKILWTFQATRPSASSGTRGSGVELRNVKFKGKTVLYQAHVPILNVEYEQAVPGCGPHYRDWQYAELPLQCQGRDLATGFRLCSSPAKTILDPPQMDGGDFVGVAVYVDGLEVVLKSQMEAGWYRYISEWRFHVDGTLRPRFGFGGLLEGSNCVCQVHHHHAYWRLDFDIVTAGNNVVREFNKPPIIGNSNYHDKSYEIRRPKDLSHERHWEVSNLRTHDTYSLTPGPNDGASDAFGVGDLWVLRYHPNELDDGVAITAGTADATRANMDKFLNGEPTVDKDVVIWYGAHFKHDQNHEGGGSHIVGPTIKPLRW